MSPTLLAGGLRMQEVLVLSFGRSTLRIFYFHNDCCRFSSELFHPGQISPNPARSVIYCHTTEVKTFLHTSCFKSNPLIYLVDYFSYDFPKVADNLAYNNKLIFA